MLNNTEIQRILLVIINIILLQCCRTATAYKQISTSGSNGDADGAPKIYKAVNFDLLFPKSFNSSENVVSTTPETVPLPTKTATSGVGQPYYPLPQSNEPTYTAAIPNERQQKPILFVTPATATTEPATMPATANEAVIYDTQENINGNKYNSQVVAQNAINIQQKQQQKQEQEQQQQHNDNKKVENEQEQEFATGRAVDYHTSYPFGQVITPLIKTAARPAYRKPITTFPVYSPSSSPAAVKLAAPSNVGKIIYPQAKYQQKSPSQAEIDKLRGKGRFRDRFSPSEGVASHAFKSNNDHTSDHTHDHHNHAPSYKPAGKIPSSSNVVNSYVTPSNLYAFPPNNVNYPVQPQDNRVALALGSADSYSWPASGSLKNSNLKLNTASSSSNPYQYNGPVSGDYLPPANEGDSGGSADEDKNNDDSDDNGTGDDTIGVLPASAMSQGDGNSNGDMADAMNTDMTAEDDKKMPDDNSYDTEKEYPTPPPGWLKEHPESAQDHPHYDHHHHPKKPDIEFVQDHDYRHHHPDIVFDHDHDHYHNSFPSYSSFPTHHSHYPDIINDEHHHDHPYIEHPQPTTTTEAPPPEPPQEPRVKKYSYFYIGRKLWYIPLYFTVWFSFYVLWLILKSIARHKVNLPNHYVSRRSVGSDDFPQRQQEIINQLTVSVLDKIDKFKRKYMIFND